MNRITTFYCGIIAALVIAGHAAGQGQPRRLALVIGNDDYVHVTKLKKAVNDANAMERELKAAGFEVSKHLNVADRAQEQALARFTKTVRGGDEVVLFFAGHGVQIKTGSYLLPVDIQVTNEREVEKFALGLQDLMDTLAASRPAFTLVIVDACRDNPLPKAAGRSVGVERGLNPMEPAKGQMVIYSAGKGQSALDRLSETDANPNGVFTRELIKRMRQPGVKVRDLVDEVQDSVEKLAHSVGHEQRPAVYSEARGNFYFVAPATAQGLPSDPSAAAATPRAASSAQREDKFWDEAKAIGTVDGYQAYLDQYPRGDYAGLARASIKRLTAAPAPVASTPGPTPSAASPQLPAAPPIAMATPSAPSNQRAQPESGKEASSAPSRNSTGVAAPSNSSPMVALAAAPASCSANNATRPNVYSGWFRIEVPGGIACAVVEYHTGNSADSQKVTITNGSASVQEIPGRRLYIVGCHVCP